MNANPWIQTLGSGAFDLLDPTPEQVDLVTLPVALSRIARFNGHTDRGFVSVAQHTLAVTAIVAYWGEADAVPYALLHDAHEAYIGDITSPVAAAIVHLTAPQVGPPPWRCHMNPVGMLKRRADAAIHAAAGLGPALDERRVNAGTFIHAADLAALDFERKAFMTPPPRDWGVPFAPDPDLPDGLMDFYRLSAGEAARMLCAQFRAHLPVFLPGDAACPGADGGGGRRAPGGIARQESEAG